MSERITIDANLVADPDFGVGDSGTSWAHFRIPSHERIRRDGEWMSTDPESSNATLIGATTETCHERPPQEGRGHRPGLTPARDR